MTRCVVDDCPICAVQRHGSVRDALGLLRLTVNECAWVIAGALRLPQLVAWLERRLHRE